jgi:hypothetical protein
VTANYQHAEAFRLMTYVSDDGTETEQIWNSRDGVTPFVISLRSGKAATHTGRRDIYAPEYVPVPGERMFVDLTPERALDAARRNLERWAAEGMDMTDAPTAEQLANEYVYPGAPNLIEVK